MKQGFVKGFCNKGQASVEYLMVSTGVLIAIVVGSTGYDVYCASSGNESCEGLWQYIGSVFSQEIYQITKLLNLP